MKNLANALLILGLFLCAYAVFSKFYGQPSVALKCIQSRSLLIAGNSLLLLSLITTVKDLCKK